jgi:hypothetical protein
MENLNDEEQKKQQKRFTVCIYISRFNESPERAIKSALVIKHLVSKVFLISPELTKKMKLYDNFTEDKKELKKFGIDLEYTDKLEIDKLNTSLLISIPADCLIVDKDELFQKKLLKNCQMSKDLQRISLGSFYDFSEVPIHKKFGLLFVCIIFCIDWWRQLFSWFTFYTEHNINISEVWRGDQRVVIPPFRSPWFSCCGYGNKGDRKEIIKLNGEMIKCSPKVVEGSYLFYFLEKRTGFFGQGWKGWFLIYFTFIVFVGIPWYGEIISKYTPIPSRIPNVFLVDLITFFLNPFSSLRIIMLINSMFIHYFILHCNFRWFKSNFWNWISNIAVAFSFYFLTPLVFWVLIASKIERKYSIFKSDVEL